MGTRVDSPYSPIEAIHALRASPSWLAKWRLQRTGVLEEDPLCGRALPSSDDSSRHGAFADSEHHASSILFSQHGLYHLFPQVWRRDKEIRNSTNDATANLAASLGGARLSKREIDPACRVLAERNQQHKGDELHRLSCRAAGLADFLENARQSRSPMSEWESVDDASGSHEMRLQRSGSCFLLELLPRDRYLRRSPSGGGGGKANFPPKNLQSQ